MFSVVVRNLAMNALKYTSADGEVTLSSKLSGNMLVISIKDTGIGMPQGVQDKLFKLSETKSRRGTNNESGVGLGLILCADFVKANGGKIWFNSKQGEGSTFFFSIPVKGN
jgi:two-component system sensor histidine kinase/response regulator